MDIRIGLTDTPRELEIELPDDSDAAEITKRLSKAITDGEPLLAFTDRRGREVLVAAAKIAWAEIGTGLDRRVGFGG